MVEIICLGQNCEPKEMLEAYWAEREAAGGFDRQALALRGRYLFDWTLLSERSLVKALKTDFADIFEPGQCRVHEDGTSKLNTVMDDGSGIMFHHLFSRDTDEIVSQQTIDAEFDVLRPKVRYLVDKMRAAMAHPGHVYFIRRWSPIERMTRHVVEALAHARKGRPFTLVSVVYEPSPYQSAKISKHLVEMVVPAERQFQLDAWRPVFEQIEGIDIQRERSRSWFRDMFTSLFSSGR